MSFLGFMDGWPSGLRRAVQVRISPGAQVRTLLRSDVFEPIFGFKYFEKFFWVVFFSVLVRGACDADHLLRVTCDPRTPAGASWFICVSCSHA